MSIRVCPCCGEPMVLERGRWVCGDSCNDDPV